MKRRPGLRYVVRFDTRCAISTIASAAAAVEDAQRHMHEEAERRGGRVLFTPELARSLPTAATNAAGERLLQGDVIEFSATVQRWCQANCEADFDLFTADQWAAPRYGYFASATDADAFAVEFKGNRGRHPTKREEAGLLGMEGQFDLTADMLKQARGNDTTTTRQ